MKSLSPSSEQLWLRVLQKNDMQALEQLYKQFYPNLYQYALKLTTENQMAEDAVQDTFLYLWQHRKQIGAIQSIRFYLLRSVRNASFKLIRKKKKRISLEEMNTQIDVSILPDELVISNINETIKQRIASEINQLSPRQREIIYLKFYQNLDYEEIGEVLDINYQSVVNHVYKAIQKLRKSKVLQFFNQR